MLKSQLFFGRKIFYDPNIDYGIKNSQHRFGLLNVENFLNKLSYQDKAIVKAFLRERIYELRYIVKFKKIVISTYGSLLDYKKNSLIRSYQNTINLFENIVRAI